MSRARIAALAFACASLSCAQLGVKNPVDQLVNKANELKGDKACTRAELAAFELSPDNEYWFGRSITARLLAPYASKNAVYEPDAPLAIYLNQVGQVAVASAVEQLDPGATASDRKFPSRARKDDAPDRPMPTRGYRFILVKDPNPGAWGVPGGFVLVTDGLVARTATEDQLAGVLAHEVAHIQRGHGVEIFKDAMCRNDASWANKVNQEVKRNASAAGGAFGKLPLDMLTKAVDFGANTIINRMNDKGYGELYEEEADLYGSRYLAGAGYSASAIADFLWAADADRAMSANGFSHFAPHLRAKALDQEIAAEHLAPARSPNELLRAPRLQKALADAQVKPVPETATRPAS